MSLFFTVLDLCEVKNVCMLFLYGMFDWKCDPYSNTVQLICSFVRLIHSFARTFELSHDFLRWRLLLFIYDWYGDALRHDINDINTS